MPDRPSLHWSRVAALALVLALVVIGLLQMNGRADPAPQPEPVLHSTRADLGELDDRKRLAWIADRDRGYFGTRTSLYHSCHDGSPETYYSNGSEAFRQPESEEVLIERHATDRGATAWQAPAGCRRRHRNPTKQHHRRGNHRFASANSMPPTSTRSKPKRWHCSP